jgi:ribosomal protein L22
MCQATIQLSKTMQELTKSREDTRAASQAAEAQQTRADTAERLSQRQAEEIAALQRQLALKPLERIVEHEQAVMTDRSVQTNAAAELGHDPFVLNLLDRLHEALARANLTARAFKAALDKADLKAEGRLGVTAVKKVAKRLVPKRAAPLYESLPYMLPCGSGVPPRSGYARNTPPNCNSDNRMRLLT